MMNTKKILQLLFLKAVSFSTTAGTKEAICVLIIIIQKGQRIVPHFLAASEA